MGVYDQKFPLLVINCFDAFGIGGIYAFVLLRGDLRTRFERVVRKIVVIPLVMYGYWKIAEYTYQPQYCLFLCKTAESIISLWLIILIINNTSTVVKRYLLESRVLNFIGKISYGLYLYHIPLIILVRASLQTQLSIIALKYPAHYTFITGPMCEYMTMAILLLIISSLSYYLIEQPVLRMKRLFRFTEIE